MTPGPLLDNDSVRDSPLPGAPVPAAAGPVLVNPVLPGFHPDPSILRVGDDYYIATSTFEWLPGVTVHHSRDLVHWTPMGGLLQDARLLDLAGRPDSGGVWAPCLSYTDGLFHLVYSDVTNLAGAFKDVRNQVTTAPSLQGPWSDPVPFPSHGFDPSLFHDDGPDGDGRSWALWMEWDHRPGRHPFAGILLQEWDRTRGAVTGPVHRVFTGTELAHTEGPHLYRKDGRYYLLTAEGGTSWDHAVTVARSKTLTGPYEADPAGPLLTSRHHPEAPLQKAGHGSLVETPAGEWYLAHLTARPLTPRGACVLGRETGLQKVEWTADGWPRVAGEAPVRDGESLPRTAVPAPKLRALTPSPSSERRPATVVSPDATRLVSPDSTRLVPPWSTLRRHPDPAWLAPLPEGVRLYGGQSLGSTHGQSLVARRQQAVDLDFSVRLDARPDSPLTMAGLVHYYNTTLWHYAHLTWDDDLGLVLRLGVCAHGRYTEPAEPQPVADGPVELRLTVRGAEGRFAWRQPERTVDIHATDDAPTSTDAVGPWRPVGDALDVSLLSDESATRGDAASGHYTAWGFTGAFVGLCAQDLAGGRMPADFTRPVCHERPGVRPERP
ncbi:glycoside hydrolase family 43 protein [Streptomyces sp. NPDC055055]